MHTGKILNSSVCSLSLFPISLHWLIECPVMTIFHNVFNMCFSKPFWQALSIIIAWNKVLASDQHRMVDCLYLKQKKGCLSKYWRSEN